MLQHAVEYCNTGAVDAILRDGRVFPEDCFKRLAQKSNPGDPNAFDVMSLLLKDERDSPKPYTLELATIYFEASFEQEAKTMIENMYSSEKTPEKSYEYLWALVKRKHCDLSRRTVEFLFAIGAKPTNEVLRKAVIQGHAGIVDAILHQKEVDTEDCLEDAAIWSLRSNTKIPEIVSLLLKDGRSIPSPEILEYAQSGNTRIVKLLLADKRTLLGFEQCLPPSRDPIWWCLESSCDDESIGGGYDSMNNLKALLANAQVRAIYETVSIVPSVALATIKQFPRALALITDCFGYPEELVGATEREMRRIHDANLYPLGFF
jgi:hypothetical protein